MASINTCASLMGSRLNNNPSTTPTDQPVEPDSKGVSLEGPPKSGVSETRASGPEEGIAEYQLPLSSSDQVRKMHSVFAQGLLLRFD